MLVDSHCHLNYEGLVEQQADVLARARAAGVGTMLNMSGRLSASILMRRTSIPILIPSV